MKYLLLLCVVVGYVSCEKFILELSIENARIMSETIPVCIKESGVDTDIMLQIKERNYAFDDTFFHYVYCLQSKLGFSNLDGTLKYEEFSNFFGRPQNEELKKIVDDCNGRKDKDANKTAGNIFKCFQQQTEINFNQDKI